MFVEIPVFIFLVCILPLVFLVLGAIVAAALVVFFYSRLLNAG